MTENGFMSLLTELVAKNKCGHHRHSFAYGTLCVIALIVFTTGSTGPHFPQRIMLHRERRQVSGPYSMGESLSGSFYASYFNGTWINDNEIFYQDMEGHLKIYNANDGTSRIIFNVTNSLVAESFLQELSADSKYLLIAMNYKKLFRTSYTAKYKILDMKTHKIIDLVVDDKEDRLQAATWAPKGNALAFVKDNDIYYRPSANVSDNYRITNTGVPGVVYNGVPDWVYEEEIFFTNKAQWFSPDGRKLVFGHFNDTETPVMHIPYYGDPGNLSFQYPTDVPIHYPKAGTTNPKVQLYAVDLDKVLKNELNLIEIETVKELKFEDKILTSVSYPADDLVSATWTNRIQNAMYVQLCNFTDRPNCTTVFSYKEKNGWVEPFFSPMISKDGKTLLSILPQKQKNGVFWRHLLLIKNARSENPVRRALTSGTFEVARVVSWDQKRDIVYYMASTEVDPAQLHLYKVSLKSAKTQCISCNLKTKFDNAKCLYSTAQFSLKSTYFAFTCLGPGVPETSIRMSNSKKLKMWENNEEVARLMLKEARPKKMRTTIPISKSLTAQVQMLVPPNADLSGNTKYPMLVNVYGGPSSNQVTEQFKGGWGSNLVTNKSIIYTVIDGRGSGMKGNDMLFSVYRSLGTVEIYDQINVTRQLQEKYPFIDKSNTAIWGWSYGGYATGLALAMDYNGVFKCGMSVAPVTDWTLYDSFYTEKYMGLPTSKDNLNGYEKASILNKVDNIKKKSYYLIHGTMDDNVHYQQSLFLAKVLEQSDILFRQQSYTDEDHGIGYSQRHLYHSLENFLFEDCFKKNV